MKPAQRPFWGVLAAGATSRLANAVGTVAYPWLALDIAGPAFAGAIAAAILAPLALGHALAGPIVERFGVRPVAILGEGLSAASAVAIAALVLLGALTAEIFVALAVAGAALDGPARAANQARWPEIARLARVPLSRATALDATTEHAATLLGPTLAGLAIAWFPIHAALGLIAVLALIACALVALAMPRFQPKRGEAATLRGIAAGARTIATIPVLAAVTAVGAVAVAAFAALESVILPAIARFSEAGAVGLTAYLAAAGLGALAGSGAIALLKQTPPFRLLFPVTLAGMAGGVACLALGPAPITMAMGGAIVGLSYGALGPALGVVFLTAPPTALRAHVGGLSNALMLTFAPVAAYGAGLGFETFGAGAMPLIGAGILFVLAVLTFAMPDPPTKKA